MKIFLLVFSLAFGLHAIKYEELAKEDYRLKVGLDKEAKVTGVEEKKKIYNKPAVVKKVKIENKMDLKEAYILSQIQGNTKKSNLDSIKKSSNLLAAPETLLADLKQANLQAKQNQSRLNQDVKRTAILKFVRCETISDYKVNNLTNINLYCKDLTNKNDVLYKLRARLSIKQEKPISLIASPYILEDEFGKTYEIEQKNSRLFNSLSGDNNIATYVDRKEIEAITKAMAKTASVEAPKLTQDYLDKKNSTDSTVIQTDTSTTTATNSPEPSASDYGISFLLSVIASGVSAGIDQLYMDLGYVYFIPKGTIVDGEIFIYE